MPLFFFAFYFSLRIALESYPGAYMTTTIGPFESLKACQVIFETFVERLAHVENIQLKPCAATVEL